VKSTNVWFASSEEWLVAVDAKFRRGYFMHISMAPEFGGCCWWWWCCFKIAHPYLIFEVSI
jgi:hypothetical protein